jgi:hypothetical protein
MSKGDLTRVANQEIESYGGDGIDPDGVQNVKDKGTTYKRDDTEEDYEANNHPESAKVRFKDIELFLV